MPTALPDLFFVFRFQQQALPTMLRHAHLYMRFGRGTDLKTLFVWRRDHVSYRGRELFLLRW